MNDLAKIWTCSDWHLGHDKLVELAHRPGCFSEMIDARLGNCGIEPGDLLINLGDVYLGERGEKMADVLLSWAVRADINTILIRGNHDSKRMAKLMRMGWTFVCDSTSFTYHGKRLLFTHEPMITDFEEDFNIHGHLHQIDGHRGGLIRDGRHILLSCEMMDYRPIRLDRLLEIGSTPQWKDGKFIAADIGAPTGVRTRTPQN